MNLRKFLLTFLAGFLLFLTGCSKISIPTNANTAFSNFTLCLFQEEVSGNTLNLHYSLQNPASYGITETPITFGSYDFSQTAALASIENLDCALHKFSYDTLSAENQLTYDILSHYFAEAKEGASFYLYEEPLSPVTGIHAQLPVLLAEYQFQNTSDVETYLALLETLPEFYDSLIRFEQQKAGVGLFMSDTLADEVISQCNAFLSMGDENYLLSTFEERLSSLEGLSEAAMQNYRRQNEAILETSVLPAYENLASAITALKGSGENEKGLCYFPEGKAYYEHLVRSCTGSSRTVAELSELIQNQIVTDLLDSQAVLDENPSIIQQTISTTQTPDAILQTLETQIGDAFPDCAAVNVSVKYVPDALEEYLSPAFYLIPAIDNYTENVIYINQAYSMEDISLFTTLAHEGYPGHLYQTTYYAATNPDPIRTLLNFPGYVEGWATYAEMCSYYICSLEKPMATLLQKNNSIILGLYAAADIGIHYEGWSVEDTVEFFSKYGIDDAQTIQEIYELILGDPANYLTYYIGYVEILELKKETMGERGDTFSQKEFHQRLLEIGPAPFEIIAEYM